MTPRRAQSDGQHAASYYGTSTPIPTPFDTLPPNSPPRVEIAASAPPVRVPLEETPPPSLIEIPSGDRSVATAPGALQQRMSMIVAVSAFVLTLTFALGFVLVWLTVRMRPPAETPAATSPPEAASALPSASASVVHPH